MNPPADEPATPKAPASEKPTTEDPKDGAQKLDELKAEAAKQPEGQVDFRANEKVPYEKVEAVVEALKSEGVTDLTFGLAKVANGRYFVRTDDARRRVRMQSAASGGPAWQVRAGPLAGWFLAGKQHSAGLDSG